MTTQQKILRMDKTQLLTPDIFQVISDKENLTPLAMQKLLGIHSAQFVRGKESPRSDKPLDHVLAGLCRFILNNGVESLRHMDLMLLLRKNSIEDLIQIADKTAPVLFFGRELLVETKTVHMAILTMRGYATTFRRDIGKSDVTESLSSWIGIIIHCLSTGQQQLITDVLEEQAIACGFDKDTLFSNKGWIKPRID